MFSENHLFSGGRLNEIFIDLEKSCFREIDNLESDYILNVDIQELIIYLESHYLFEIPKIQEDKISVDHQEENRDISQDPDKNIYDRTKPVYIKGTSIKFFIPFTGNSHLFPNGFNTPQLAAID